jgi:hypothetical protein
MTYQYKLKPGSGDEITLSEMTPEELMAEWTYWNRTLPHTFHKNSGQYDAQARLLKDIEAEMERRDIHGLSAYS